MIFRNKKFMKEFVSIKQGKVNLRCDDLELKEKIIKLLEVLSNNVDRDWDNANYLDFFKQLSKLDVNIFNDSHDEIIRLLNLRLDLVELRLRDLDKKLGLHLFDDERYMETVKVTKIENGKEVEVSIQKLTFKPHNFSTADIVLFFQRLNSEINKNTLVAREFHNNIINKCDTLESKQYETKLLLTLLDEKDSDICSKIIESYYEWFKLLPNDDPMYIYLETRVPYIFNLFRKYLMDKLTEYDRQSGVFSYIKEKHAESKNKQAKEKQRLNGYRRQFIRS